MDFDLGGGNILKDLPCRVVNHQLSCSDRGRSYPDLAISTYVDDNKALLRRMFGVTGAQEDNAKTVTQTTIRIVRTFGPEKYASKQQTKPLMIHGVPEERLPCLRIFINMGAFFLGHPVFITFFRVVSSSLLENRFPRSSNSFLRFRRDIPEGTIDDMMFVDNSNVTASDKVKRQANLPRSDDNKLDKSK